MKIDLCKIFGVEEKQHFWIDYDHQGLEEMVIKNNFLYYCDDETKIETLSELEFNDIPNLKVYYKKPIILTENTKQFLKLIKKDYKYLARDNGITLCLSAEKPKKNNSIGMWDAFPKYIVIKDEAFDIDLSFIKWEDEEPYNIEELLKESE